MEKIKVLHVDDSAVIRGIIGRILEGENDIELLNSAGNGKIAVDTYKKHKPDIVIMDIEMPIMDGITALQEIIEFDRDAKVIMCSTLSLDNAEITMRAMKVGAADYIPKPTSVGDLNGSDDFKSKLLHLVRNIKKGSVPFIKKANVLSGMAVPSSPLELKSKPPLHWRAKVIAVGSSTGGPQALFELMKNLKGVNAPVVITQHMPATFTTLLAKHISDQTGFECVEAQDGLKLETGKAILAQGGKHMEFVKNTNGDVVVKLTDGPAINFCKPAVDPMCKSLIKQYGGNIFSIILTGMGHDGLDGVKDIVDAGGYVIAQDQETSVVWGMPGSVAMAGLCSAVLPLDDIAKWTHDNVKV